MIRKAYMTILGTVLALGLLVFVPSARADLANQATRLTFNQSVDLPNHEALPAGTYWFVVDPTIPNVVHVYNADRMQPVTTLMSIPTIRANRTDRTQLTFSEQPKGEPIALVKWYYPDRLTGHEFLYSSRRESQMSEENKVTVLAMPPQAG